MNLLKNSLILKFAFSFLFWEPFAAHAEPATIGSKTFTESYVLGEILAQRIEKFMPVDRRFGLGGTGILFQSLQSGKIDLYVEYTGTIAEAILKQPELRNFDQMTEALNEIGLTSSQPLGFNNTYALAMRRSHAEELGIKNMSDLRNHPDLKVGVGYEFLRRSDGWVELSKVYQYKMKSVRGMEHSLGYEALDQGSIDLMDVYTTDAKLNKFDLYVLEDDLQFFPRYEAVILARSDFVKSHPQVWESLVELEGSIDEERMILLNSSVDLDGASFLSVAQNFWSQDRAIEKRYLIPWKALWKRAKEHLFLIFFSLASAILVGVPLGVLAAQSKIAAQIVISVSGLVQTIPSLALLCFFIPLLGIGVIPALAALFLYALLPIVRGTFSGLQSVDNEFREITQIVGMSRWQSLWKVELPLSAVHIMSGIKTSMVINVGTATLAAFIGAGGLGSFIVTGLALNETRTILLGAIPAAILAILLQYGFEALDRFLIPRGIRLTQGSV